MISRAGARTETGTSRRDPAEETSLPPQGHSAPKRERRRLAAWAPASWPRAGPPQAGFRVL